MSSKGHSPPPHFANPLGGSLSGVQVLDFSTNVAGPYASMILADFGAEVLKVERPGGGDPSRAWDPSTGENSSAVYEALNHGKKSIELDLKERDDVGQALGLVEESDLLLESFRPGVMARLGLGVEDARTINPSIVYCSISGFGYEPEASGRGAYDPLIQAFAGHMMMTGEPSGDPVRSGASIVDVSAGMWTAMGALSALRLPPEQRGFHLQISLLDAILAVMGHQVASATYTQQDIPRMGSGSPLVAPYEIFATLDKPVMIAAGNEGLYARLSDALSAPELMEDERLCTNSRRITNRPLLRERIEAHTRHMTATDLINCLDAAGVPCSVVNSLLAALQEPLVQNRDVLQPSDGTMQFVRNPVRVAERPILQASG